MGNQNQKSSEHDNKRSQGETCSKGTAADNRFRPAFDRLKGDEEFLQESALQAHFGANFGRALWKHLTKNIPNSNQLDFSGFSLALVPLLGTSTDVYIPTLCYDGLNKDSVSRLLRCCSLASGVQCDLETEPFAMQLTETIISSCSCVEDLVSWKARYCPELCVSLQNLLRKSLNLDNHPAAMMACDYNSDVLSPFEMCAEQGISINRFETNVFGYRGPTVSLLRLIDRSLFVLAVDQEWRSSTQKFGGPNSMVMQLLAEFKAMENLVGNVYFNVKTRGTVQGLVIGDIRSPFMQIDGDLSNLDLIEVWGCSGVETLQDQQRLKHWQSRQVENNKRVPLPGKWEDNPDKFLLELAGVGGNAKEHYQIVERE